MLRIKFLLGAILALTAWIHPAYAISAFAEQPQENPTFINYEKFRQESTLKPDVDEKQPSKPTPQKLVKKSNDIQLQSVREYSGRNYSKDEVIELIKSYSAQYGIKSDTALCIAQKESGFNQFSKNRNSTASGVFQYISGTWKATDEGLAGLSVFNADANVRAAIKYMSSRGKTSPWTVAKSCPSIQKIN